MSLNDIRLKPNIIAAFYNHSLVETSATTMPESKPLHYLGSNQKNILVIVSNSDIPFLPDAELNFLTNVLTACKLSLADIGIINYKTEQAQLQNILTNEAKKVLLFGVEPLAIGLPIHFPPFQLQPFNKCIYLFAPALSQIENDKGLKSKLWSALKTMFAI